MDNKIFLEQLKKIYDSLKYFEIQNNFFILKLEKNYVCPLIYTNLSGLNPSLFLLTPMEIFQVIYMLELIHKNEFTEGEISFITQYTQKYLNLNDQSKNGGDIDSNRLWNLSLPINLAYDEEFINTSSGQIITSIVDKHSMESESTLGKNPRLVLVKGDNPNFDIENEENDFKTFKDAGFTTIILILASIITTCLYIAFFIATK